MRIGRKIKEGEQPMKLVKQRAVTIHRRREIEVAGERGETEVMQGLYAERQTEQYVPDPVINVGLKILLPMARVLTTSLLRCRERYQKMTSGTSTFTCPLCFPSELYTFPVSTVDFILRRIRPLLLTTYLVLVKGIAKIARQLHFDFAEAVVSFSMRKWRTCTQFLT